MRVGESAAIRHAVRSLRAAHEARSHPRHRAVRHGLSGCLRQALLAVADRDQIPHREPTSHRSLSSQVLYKLRSPQPDARVFEQSHTRRSEPFRV